MAKPERPKAKRKEDLRKQPKKRLLSEFLNIKVAPNPMLKERRKRKADEPMTEYENQSRNVGKEWKSKHARLPFRDKSGRLVAHEVDETKYSEETDAEASTDSENQTVAKTERATEEQRYKFDGSTTKNLVKAKEELSWIAQEILEDPEKHIGHFRRLSAIFTSGDVIVKKLALVTQLSVFKDIIPEYRIRESPLAEDKLSKDVKMLREYEKALFSAYSQYVHLLEDLCGGKGDQREQSENLGSSEDHLVRETAYICTCRLLEAVAHFNLRQRVMRIIIKRVSKRTNDSIYSRCLQSLKTLFGKDENGYASLEAVRMLVNAITETGYRVRTEVIELFLSLRLLQEYSPSATRNVHSVISNEKAAENG